MVQPVLSLKIQTNNKWQHQNLFFTVIYNTENEINNQKNIKYIELKLNDILIIFYDITGGVVNKLNQKKTKSKFAFKKIF